MSGVSCPLSFSTLALFTCSLLLRVIKKDWQESGLRFSENSENTLLALHIFDAGGLIYTRFVFIC